MPLLDKPCLPRALPLLQNNYTPAFFGPWCLRESVGVPPSSCRKPEQSMDPIPILIVEDEFLIQDLLEHELKEAGFAVVTASTADDAFERLKAEMSYFRALVTDINLQSEVSGWDVARYARRMNSGIPVIYMTGDSGADWAVNGVPNSILVTKPFAPVQIISAGTAPECGKYDGRLKKKTN